MVLRELIVRRVKENLPGIKFTETEHRGDLTLYLEDKKDIVKLSEFLKNDEELYFNFCDDVTAIDWARRKNRFTVVYHIFSMKHNFRLRLKADVDESDCNIDTVSSIWRTTNWHERETYDMYGITFNNHPDLRRMYMPENFEYHPLRKDYPLMGIPGSLTLPKK